MKQKRTLYSINPRNRFSSISKIDETMASQIKEKSNNVIGMRV